MGGLSLQKDSFVKRPIGETQTTTADRRPGFLSAFQRLCRL